MFLLHLCVSYRADAHAGGGLTVRGGAAGSGGNCTSGGRSWKGDELDALWQSLLLLEVTDQLSLSLSSQLLEQGVLGKLLLQGQ